jgi:holo-[acyl-carrier protein] synthase
VPLRVGIDLVGVEAIESSLAGHPEQYLRRVYTDREVRDCSGEDGIAPERLAARFAAKEATIKVLRPGVEDALPLTTIEIQSGPDGAPSLHLSGQAAELARAAGIENLQLSVTHEGLQACAVVIAELSDSCR